MFSDQDVQDIIRLIPPSKVSYSEPSKGLPSLVFSSTGNGLIASNHIERQFSDIIEYGMSVRKVGDIYWQNTSTAKIINWLPISRSGRGPWSHLSVGSTFALSCPLKWGQIPCHCQVRLFTKYMFSCIADQSNLFTRRLWLSCLQGWGRLHRTTTARAWV